MRRSGGRTHSWRSPRRTRVFRPITRGFRLPSPEHYRSRCELGSAPDVFIFKALTRYVGVRIHQRTQIKRRGATRAGTRGRPPSPENAASEAEYRLALLPEGIQNAIGSPTAGRPAYQTLYVRAPRLPYFLNNRKLLDPEPPGRQGYRFQGPGKSGVRAGGSGASAHDERKRRYVFPYAGARLRCVPSFNSPCTRKL